MDVIIVNPVAGNGISLKYLEYMKYLYHYHKRSYKVFYTGCDGAFLASRYFSSLENVQNIVSIGGDGTLNEVVNGMINSHKGLIIVPGGSGNDFYRSIVNYNNDFLCDVGKANDDYFLGTLSIGVDAMVADYANYLKKEHTKGNVYIKSVLHTMPKFDNTHISFNNEEKSFNQDVTMLSFCNSNYYGKGIKISPNASVTDGLFEVYLIDEMKRVKVPFLFIKLLLCLHEKDKSVNHFQANGGLIEFPEHTIYSFDGETRKSNKIKLEMIKEKLLIKKDFHEEVKKLVKKSF